MATRKISRSAETGKFVTKQTAQRKPKTTVTETVTETNAVYASVLLPVPHRW